MLRTFCLVALVAGASSAAMGITFDPSWIPGFDPNWMTQAPTNIEISNLTGTFTLGGGANGLGVLTIAAKTGGPSITVHYEGASDWSLPLSWAKVGAAGNLYADTSGIAPLLANQAEGWFNGNGIADPDWHLGLQIPLLGYASILDGSLDIYRLREIYNTNELAGSGLATATGGTLVDWGIWPDGGQQSSISSYQFRIRGVTVDNFTKSFSGDMYLTFWPDAEHGVPEPITLSLMAAGLGMVAFRARARRS
jgi:hypothetical protein